MKPILVLVVALVANGYLGSTAYAQSTPVQKKAQPSGHVEANPDALVLVDFKKRIDKYVEIHKQAAKTAPPSKQTHDPKQIQAAEEGLAASIRVARSDAKIGDVFTPEIRDK